MVASYSELYEEGEVEHINCVWPVFLLKTAIFSSNNVIIVVTSGVWPQLRIKTACALATSAFGLALSVVTQPSTKREGGRDR